VNDVRGKKYIAHVSDEVQRLNEANHIRIVLSVGYLSGNIGKALTVAPDSIVWVEGLHADRDVVGKVG